MASQVVWPQKKHDGSEAWCAFQPGLWTKDIDVRGLLHIQQERHALRR